MRKTVQRKLLIYLPTTIFVVYLLSLLVSVSQKSLRSASSFVDFVRSEASHQRGDRCDKLLFVGTPASEFTLSGSYKSLKPAFVDIIRRSGYIEAFEGHSGRSAIQTLALHYLASRPTVHTVCETGYNVGHSAFNYLTANPRLVVHSFDIGQYEWTLPSAQNLSQLFPGRLFVHIGDSAVTVPKFLSENPSLKCNLILIDGCHNYPCAKLDIENFASVAEFDNNVIIMDDYPSPNEHGPAWDEAINDGYVKEFVSCRLAQDSGELEHAVGFAVGQVVSHPKL
jgi:hypothetical protein